MIVAVVSETGGVGRSTIALNLGYHLEAVVVDADRSMTDLSRGRGPDLQDVLSGRAGPLEAVRQVGPVELVAGGRSLVDTPGAELASLEETLGTLDREFGGVVVDCPAGHGPAVAAVVGSADAVVLVTNDDEAATREVTRTTAFVREVGTRVGAIVCNRVEDGHETGLEDALGGPLTLVPEEPVVRVAQSTGRPVASIDPENVVVERIVSLARTLEGGPRRVILTAVHHCRNNHDQSCGCPGE